MHRQSNDHLSSPLTQRERRSTLKERGLAADTAYLHVAKISMAGGTASTTHTSGDSTPNCFGGQKGGRVLEGKPRARARGFGGSHEMIWREMKRYGGNHTMHRARATTKR